ncbi:MAG: HAMP domain-containing histidine kinase [Firmicutes bacterium]|nr:HAMP domain-containing histidine kinase [Bacillota bacterium]
MKKLKNKVFWVIFSLLTVFTFIIFTTSITRTYIERRNSISERLTKIPRTFEDISRHIPSRPEQNDDSRRIFLDSKIYTVLLDDNGNYEGVINHTNNDNFNEEYVKSIANKIINNHKEKFYIGNLYTDKYSYSFTSYNTLIIIDNTELNSILVSNLISTILLFIICEIIILIITNLITNWIITPVKNSFEKQKTFVADASHELKTPLSVMIASSDAYFNDKNDKWVKNIKNEAERMTKLVTELLDLAKTEQEQEIIMEEKNISDIIESSILTFESLFYDNKIKLKYDITPDIKMICNENLIIELISILTDNAIKHCEEKGKVFVNLYQKNKQIILEVKNKGLPIKKEDEEKIFERFYKVDTSRNRNSNNYGLGLAIAKNIVERHNGEIKAYSNDGYTTFKVTWNQK